MGRRVSRKREKMRGNQQLKLLTDLKLLLQNIIEYAADIIQKVQVTGKVAAI